MDNENQSVEHELDQIERSPEYQEALIRHRDAYRKIQRIMLPEIPLIVLVIVEAAEKPARQRKAIEPAEKLTRRKGRWGSRWSGVGVCVVDLGGGRAGARLCGVWHGDSAASLLYRAHSWRIADDRRLCGVWHGDSAASLRGLALVSCTQLAYRG